MRKEGDEERKGREREINMVRVVERVADRIDREREIRKEVEGVETMEEERERERDIGRVRETHLQTDLEPSALVKYTFPVWV